MTGGWMNRRGRARTDDLFRVREALSQLSYAPALRQRGSRLAIALRESRGKAGTIAAARENGQRDPSPCLACLGPVMNATATAVSTSPGTWVT